MTDLRKLLDEATPGPWPIQWYVCIAEADDVKSNNTLVLGDTMWRSAQAIGPLSPNHDHWAGWHLTMNEADARLASFAPQIAEALLVAMKGLRVIKVSSTCAVSRGVANGTLVVINKIMGE